MAALAGAQGRGRAAGGEGMSSLCAIICVRNEAGYLPALLEHLSAEGVEAAFIDNGSDDGTEEIIRAALGHGVCRIASLPYDGSFNLTAQLEAKAVMAQELPHAWLLHQDADEILQHNVPGKRLTDLVEDAEADGANAINFDEFVFLPPEAEPKRPHREWTGYYFFEPHPMRLMRLWQRDCNLDNLRHAGHKLEGDLRLLEGNHILRHYIGLSAAHLTNKYVGRKFAQQDQEKGWHRNRLDLAEAMLNPERVPASCLLHLADFKSRDFVRTNPWYLHYWQRSFN